jgi:sugar (pentulose or hexulose) kinase
MSLIGIDLGSSSIKVAAFSAGGRMLAGARRTVHTTRTEAGHSEIDVLESRDAFDAALAEVAARPELREDPPVAMSFSSSGREVFPVAADGTPLGPCLMTADTRGDEVAAEIAALRAPEDWFRVAGHVPRRMDPISRALWWRKTRPDVTAQARWFMNWHEYYALLLSGKPVVDWSDAGAWAVYDVEAGTWSPERVAETGIDPTWLPDVQPNASPIGKLQPGVAARFGLPADTLVVTGAWDAFAAAVGSGGVDPGVVALACGTWHSFTVPVKRGWPPELVREGMNVSPHPGPTGFGILGTNPNGTIVIDWARELLQMSIEELEAGLARAGAGPASVATDAALTPLPHVAGGDARGATFSGVNLATSRLDVARALLEAIACELALTLQRLRACGVDTSLIRATGGGSRLAWWMQLHADVCGIPVEIVDQDEPGAFGAAILAGVGAGVYPSVSSAVERLVTVSRRYAPDPARGALYGGLLDRLRVG